VRAAFGLELFFRSGLYHTRGAGRAVGGGGGGWFGHVIR